MLLAVTAVGLGSLSYALALAVQEQDWVFWARAADAAVPAAAAGRRAAAAGRRPRLAAGAAAAANPLRYLVDAERALFAGDVASTAVTGGLVAAVATAVLGVWVGTRAMARASSSRARTRRGPRDRGPLLGMMGP